MDNEFMPSLTSARKAGSITDVAGIEVGHFTDTRRPTGCTVVWRAAAPWPAWTCAAPRPARARPTCCRR
jgi:L-aminopeptidase/D-esterase-like protein